MPGPGHRVPHLHHHHPGRLAACTCVPWPGNLFVCLTFLKSVAAAWNRSRCLSSRRGWAGRFDLVSALVGIKACACQPRSSTDSLDTTGSVTLTLHQSESARHAGACGEAGDSHSAVVGPVDSGEGEASMCHKLLPRVTWLWRSAHRLLHSLVLTDLLSDLC